MEPRIIELLSNAADRLLMAQENTKCGAVSDHCVAALREVSAALKAAANYDGPEG